MVRMTAVRASRATSQAMVSNRAMTRTTATASQVTETMTETAGLKATRTAMAIPMPTGMMTAKPTAPTQTMKAMAVSMVG